MSKWYDDAEIKELIEIAKKLHRNFINIGLALGIRASVTGMNLLGVKKDQVEHAEVWGVKCFGEAVEVMTGCKLIRKKLKFHEMYDPPLKPKLILDIDNKRVTLKLREKEYKDINEVFNAPEKVIFEKIELTDKP